MCTGQSGVLFREKKKRNSGTSGRTFRRGILLRVSISTLAFSFIGYALSVIANCRIQAEATRGTALVLLKILM